MVNEIIRQLNWIDIFIVILLIRISYIAIKNGIFCELFKLLGVILGVYLGLHYYAQCGDSLSIALKAKAIPIEILDFLSLLSLIILSYLIFIFLRLGLERFVKLEILSTLNKWLAAVLGLIRGILIVSLIMYIFSVPVITYFKNSVQDSYLGPRVLRVAPAVYKGIWNSVMSKFMTQEKFNQAVTQIHQE